jgi:pimeloyl-ACP methyl ester carboxylesterase
MDGRSARIGQALGAGAAGLVTVGAAGWALQRRHMRRIALDPEQAILSAPPSGRAVAVRSADGTTLHAEVFGPDDAPTIVLAHGWTEALRLWIYQIRGLSSDFRIVAYDLRGHGRSEPAATDDYSFDRFGEDVEAVLATCVPEGERAVLVGHSMGAMSIAAWAEHHDVERRVSAAGLLHTGVGGLLGEHVLARVPGLIPDRVARSAFMGNRAPIPRFSSPLKTAIIRYVACAPGASPAAIAYYERMLLDCDPHVRAAVGLAMADMDLYHALPKLTVPSLVMTGELDRLTPVSHARRIAELLPNPIGPVVLPDTGHLGPLERPREVSATLRELALETAHSSRPSRLMS